MAHWAEIDVNKVVLRVIRCDADDDADGTLHPPAFCTDVLGGTWQRTYYDTDGYTYAGIGFTYDADLDDFAAPLPADPVVDD